MKKTLAELKAENVPVATCETVGITITGKADDAEKVAALRATLDAYFANFCAPRETDDELDKKAMKCVCCDRGLAGLFGTFTWGICHGEGFCGHCGHLGRGHHEIMDEGGECVATLANYVLQYHPSVLELNPEYETIPGGRAE